ncbi:hypothetical protein [Candidatus Nitrososphaera sp. FF02]|uniref:hypothetical protein n=1 Tax=Candidatus Nitrososphaera sp. FF02 TaxID=3398226 RepID=UPI0039EBC66D
MAAILVFGAVAAGLIAVPQTAYAAVTITSSADTFYGPGFVRVLITDTAFDEAGDTIFPTIEARDGNSVRGTIAPEIEAIGGSGQFEFFISLADAGLSPANPTKVTESGAGGTDFGDGPFVVRVIDGAGNTVDLAEDSGDNANAVDISVNSYDVVNSYGMDVDDGDADGDIADEFDNFRIVYGGQTHVIDFEDSTATLTADRTEAGAGTEIVLSMTDADANVDPTLVDVFAFDEGATAEAVLNSQDDIDYSAAAPDSDDMRWVETGQNTGIFELTVVVNGDPATQNSLSVTLPVGNSFTFRDHSVYEEFATALTGVEETTPESGTSSFSVTLRNRDGAVQLQADPTIPGGLVVQLTDADRNVDTGDDDTIEGTAPLDLAGSRGSRGRRGR